MMMRKDGVGVKKRRGVAGIEGLLIAQTWKKMVSRATQLPRSSSKLKDTFHNNAPACDVRHASVKERGQTCTIV
jgi:hypothetical protein